MQPINQINQPTETTSAQMNRKPAGNREAKKKFEGNCRHCQIQGHECAECRKLLRNEAAENTAKMQSR